MDAKDKARILYRLEAISQNTSNLEHLLISLQSRSILTVGEAEIIRAAPTTLGKYEALFITITRKGRHAFHLLLQILATTGNEHVARILDDELSEEEARRLNSDTELRNQLWFGIKEPVPNFCGREAEISRLFKWYAEQSQAEQRLKVTIVCGLGGIGKTELVRTFAARLYNELDAHCVWIHGETDVLVSEGFKRLASHGDLKIPVVDGQNRERSAGELATEIFTALGNKGSLLILDNVDEISSTGMVEEVLQGVTRLAPGLRRPFVLLTTRNRELLLMTNMLHLDVWTETEALDFVRESLAPEVISSDLQSAQQLCELFEFFPLALAQAASFISYQSHLSVQFNKPPFGIREYLQLYESQRQELLDYFPAARALHSYAQTTFLTWNITLAKIKEDRLLGPIAETLLNIISLFAPDSIQVQFLSGIFSKFEKTWTDLQSHSQPQTNSALSTRFLNFWSSLRRYIFKSQPEPGPVRDREQGTIDDALQLIHRFSMIHVKSGEISVHRLVQDVIQMSLGPTLIHKYLDTLLASFDKGAGCDIEYIAHVKSVWTHAVNETTDKFQLVRKYVLVPGRIWMVFTEAIYYEDAQKFAETAVGILVDALGEENPATIRMQYNRGCILCKRGQYRKALDVFSMVIEIRRRVYGEDSLETASSRHERAEVLRLTGEYQTSLEEYQKVQVVKERKLGSKHPSILIINNNMAVVLNQLGRYQEALEILLEVHELQKAKLGILHPDTLASHRNIAYTLENLGKYEEALIINEKVSRAREKILGVDHPNTLLAKQAIALNMYDLGRCEDSVNLLADVICKQEQVLGATHIYVLTSKVNYAAALSKIGRLEESLAIYADVLHESRIHGPYQPLEAITLRNKAFTLNEVGRSHEALDALTTARKQLESLGQNHKHLLLTVRANTAFTLSTMWRLEEADKIFQDVYDTRIETVGPMIPDTLVTGHNFGVNTIRMGKTAEGRQMLGSVLERRRALLGEQHPATQETLQELEKLDIKN